jgi:hypothetical protein
MLKRLGTFGLVGILLSLAGLGLVAYTAPLVAAGLALTLAGVGLVVKGLLDGLMAQFGLA